MSCIQPFFNHTLLILLPLIGYIRFLIDNKSPKYLINLSKTNSEWLKSDSWKSRLTPIFSILIIIFNYFAWLIYGFSSLLKVVGIIVLSIWKFFKFIVLWVWFEVLHPTIFLVVKLLWHYVIIFSWKFFQFSFSLIFPAYNKSNIIFSFKKLLILSSFLSFVWIFYSLLNIKFILFIGIIGFIFLFQYLIFESVHFFKPKLYKKEWVKSNLKLSLIWLIISSTAFFIIFLFTQNSNNIVIQGLSVPLTQILFSVGLIMFVLFIFSFQFLPAFTHISKGNVKSEIFFKDIFYRIPKIFFSQPFYFLGSGIVLIIPLIVSFLFLKQIEDVSNNNILNWQNKIMNLPLTSLSISENKEQINELNNKLINSEKDYNNSLKELDDHTSKKNNERVEANELKSRLVNNSIFTFEGDAYVGEKQLFSINKIESCSEYRWEIINPDNDKILLAKNINTKHNVLSYVFTHKWKNAGSYIISLTPKNSCNKAKPYIRTVNVINKPDTKLFMDNPRGNNLVCQGDTSVYTAGTLGFSEYEWEIPKNTSYYGNQKDKKIKVVWGDTPGTIRVKGIKKDNGNHIINSSIWSGLLVNISPNIGNKSISINKTPDETIQIKPLKRPFIFYTLDEANSYISALDRELEKINDNKDNIISNYQLSSNRVNSQIDTINSDSDNKRAEMLGIILAIFGFSLLISITFSTLWTYQITYNFELYNFEQLDTHYWKKQLNNLNSNNNQPLLGWFVLTLFISIIIIISYLCSINF